jgi:hypothetical protein
MPQDYEYRSVDGQRMTYKDVEGIEMTDGLLVLNGDDSIIAIINLGVGATLQRVGHKIEEPKEE